jgi:hypothetical protein
MKRDAKTTGVTKPTLHGACSWSVSNEVLLRSADAADLHIGAIANVETSVGNLPYRLLTLALCTGVHRPWRGSIFLHGAMRVWHSRRALPIGIDELRAAMLQWRNELAQ